MIELMVLTTAAAFLIGAIASWLNDRRRRRRVHDRTLDRYHRNRDRGSEEPRAARRSDRP